MMMNFETIKNVFSMPTNEINRRIKIRKRELDVYGGIDDNESAIKVYGEGDFKAVSNP
jgi:hypothetical protein